MALFFWMTEFDHSIQRPTLLAGISVFASNQKAVAERPARPQFDSAALYRQVHFFEQFGVSRVVVQISRQRITVDLRQSGVSLFVGTLQPSEPFLGLPAIRIP
jgi:hypothetical protein